MSGCGAGSGAVAFSDSSPTHLSGTVSLWHFWTDREAAAIKSVVEDFEKANPDVKVEIHDGQDDEKLAKVIASGGDVDVAISASTDSVGAFCSSGSFRDLDAVIERDKLDMSQFLDVAGKYTSFDGKQCTLPLLSDDYGLYFNTDLMSEGGYTEPPKTLSQLEDMALKLTTYNADGSIKTLGFDPLIGLYKNDPIYFGPAAAATWSDASGQSVLASQPGWKELMAWQKDFVDKIGYDKLKAFNAGLGDEWSADNAFQTGQLAMYLDGEWRVAFLEDLTPDINYGTAPFPTADDHTDLYGGGYISGNVMGIAKGSKHPDLAWALMTYLATDTGALVKLGNEIKNIPTTHAAITSPDLTYPAQYQTFLDIASSPHLSTKPATAIGSADQTAFANYWMKWEAGDGGDLGDGLAKVDTDINNSIALSAGP